MDLKNFIRVIPNFPKEGIRFKDITPILQNPEAFNYAIDRFAEIAKEKNVDLIVAPEARGFMVGAPLAYKLNCGFIPVRKKGKLPYDTISTKYDLEYGKDELEMHKDAIKKGQRVYIFDDLLATGGTIKSVIKLVEELGGEVVGAGFFIELTYIDGRKNLEGYDLTSLVQY